MAEERGDGCGFSDALIPEKGKASAFLEMAEGAPGNVFENDLHLHAVPESDQKVLAEGVRQRSGGAEERDSLTGHPGAHVLPVVKVGGEEVGWTGLQSPQFGPVPSPGRDGLAVMAMDKAKEIQDKRVIEADAESKSIRETAEDGVGANLVFLPPYYNKGAHQGDGKG